MPFSERQMKRLRALSEQYMKAECDINRPGLPTFDAGTGIASADGTPTLIYSGACRITPSRGPRETSVGDELVALRDADFYIPWTAALPIRDDLITITYAIDLHLVSRVYRITDVRVGETYVSRKMSAVALAPSRTSEQIPKTP